MQFIHAETKTTDLSQGSSLAVTIYIRAKQKHRTGK